MPTWAASGTGLPLPTWLPGWWEVAWRGDTYYYHFNVTQQATWTQVRPITNLMPPLIVNDTGKFIVDPGPTISIKWGRTHSEEKFTVDVGSKPPTLSGLWNGTERVTAIHL